MHWGADWALPRVPNHPNLGEFPSLDLQGDDE